MSRLLLARHAETVWHEENRYAGGRSEPGLTELGLRQAEQLGRTAVALGVDAVISSPQQRAVATAAPAATAIGVPLPLRPDLREVDFGDLEGHTLSEMDPDAVHRFRQDPETNGFPHAEPLRAAGERCATALREIDGEHDGTVLVVAHSSLFRLGLCVLLGLPVARYRNAFPVLENVALTEIRLPADRSLPAGLLNLNRLP